MSSQKVPVGILVSVTGSRRRTAASKAALQSGPTTNPRPSRRRLPLLAGAGLALVLVAAGLIIMFRSRGASSQPNEPILLLREPQPQASPDRAAPLAVAEPVAGRPSEASLVIKAKINEAPVNAAAASGALPAKSSEQPIVRATTPAPRPRPTAATKPVAAGLGPVAIVAVPFKRRQFLEREDLARQLLVVRELDTETLQGTAPRLRDLANVVGQSRQGELSGMGLFQTPRIDLAGLPFRMGADCHLDREGAENLQVLSRKLRANLQAAMPQDRADCRLDADKLREILLAGKDAAHNPWLQGEAVPALMQLLQAENTPVRLLLVELLSRIPGRKATAALARRAIADLDAEVREAAVRALADRPRQDYRAVLLEGLRYLWPPVADHAAEALVAIGDREAMPFLKKLATAPDPAAALPETNAADSGYVVRELVRVNHHSNCLLCHARSSSQTDLVRAAVPTRGQPLPPPNSSEYYEQGNSFIRADVTYLQQDFSVVQPVTNHGPWPGHQRFDYLVRLRPATRREIARADSEEAGYPQRDSVLFALRELQKQAEGPVVDKP